MRELHQLADQQTAERLAAFLTAKSISCQVDAEDRGWTVWIHRDEQREAASELLRQFLNDPNATTVTAAIRQPVAPTAPPPLTPSQARRRAEHLWQQRFQFVWYRSFPITVLLILASVITALLCTDWRNSFQRHGLFAPLCNNDDSALLDALFIQPLTGFPSTSENIRFGVVLEDGERRLFAGKDPRDPDVSGLIASFQWWRPITPIFLHFGLLHIGFNMSWIWTLGRQIEFLRGSWKYGLLVLLIAVISNFAQLYWAGPGFGGMSGVVFGLVGYAWIKGRTAPQHGIGMPYEQMVYSVLFLFLCMTGVFGAIANAAHFAGFATGICCGLRTVALKKLRHFLRT
ncbi:MAG: rhomboid family intramembrane serine protease, partial [Planctomycetota bacterium]